MIEGRGVMAEQTVMEAVNLDEIVQIVSRRVAQEAKDKVFSPAYPNKYNYDDYMKKQMAEQLNRAMAEQKQIAKLFKFPNGDDML